MRTAARRLLLKLHPTGRSSIPVDDDPSSTLIGCVSGSHYHQGCNADTHAIPKIESVDSIPNLQSIVAASDGAMVTHGDLGVELSIEEVPFLQVVDFRNHVIQSSSALPEEGRKQRYEKICEKKVSTSIELEVEDLKQSWSYILPLTTLVRCITPTIVMTSTLCMTICRVLQLCSNHELVGLL